MSILAPSSTPISSDPMSGIASAVTAIVSAVAKVAQALTGALGSSQATGQAKAGAALASGGADHDADGVLAAGRQAIQGAVAPTDAAAPAADGGSGSKAADAAKKYQGKPYVWGGTGPDGFDCSGLVKKALEDAGVKNVPRTSQEQFKGGTPVDQKDLKPGDLVFYNGTPPTHVAMYIGDGKVIHAPQQGENVKIVDVKAAGGSVSGARRYS